MRVCVVCGHHSEHVPLRDIVERANFSCAPVFIEFSFDEKNRWLFAAHCLCAQNFSGVSRCSAYGTNKFIIYCVDGRDNAASVCNRQCDY